MVKTEVPEESVCWEVSEEKDRVVTREPLEDRVQPVFQDPLAHRELKETEVQSAHVAQVDEMARRDLPVRSVRLDGQENLVSQESLDWMDRMETPARTV